MAKNKNNKIVLSEGLRKKLRHLSGIEPLNESDMLGMGQNKEDAMSEAQDQPYDKKMADGPMKKGKMQEGEELDENKETMEEGGCKDDMKEGDYKEDMEEGFHMQEEDEPEMDMGGDMDMPMEDEPEMDMGGDMGDTQPDRVAELVSELLQELGIDADVEVDADEAPEGDLEEPGMDMEDDMGMDDEDPEGLDEEMTQMFEGHIREAARRVFGKQKFRKK